MVNALNMIITHYRWPMSSLFTVNVCLHNFEYLTALSYSPSFIYSILAVNLARTIHDGFPQHIYSVKKAETGVTADSVETKTNTRWPVI
jgi:hypothetical protein